MPSGAFSVTLRPTDTLAIVFQPVVTPTGNVNTPPLALLAGQAAQLAPAQADVGVSLNYRWSRLTFWLDSLLNGRSLGRIGLLKPLTFVIGYEPALMANVNENTLIPYYWTGSAWSHEGIVVTNRNVNANRITFTVDRIVGELSFFARPNLVYLPHLHTALINRSRGVGAGVAGPNAKFHKMTDACLDAVCYIGHSEFNN